MTLRLQIFARVLAYAAVCFTSLAVADEKAAPLTDKTIVVWLAPGNVAQRGAGVFVMDDTQGRFEGLALGQHAPKRWGAVSDATGRNSVGLKDLAEETADAKKTIQIALVYQGKELTIYRDGQPYAKHAVASVPPLGSQSVVLLGRRGLRQTDGVRFAGAIDDARIYDTALTAEQIAALKPNETSTPKPWAWWTFNDAEGKDQTGRFAGTRLVGGAKVEDGRLVLDGKTGVMVASPTKTTGQVVQLPIAAPDVRPARQLRHHLLADPHRPEYHFAIPEGQVAPFDPNGGLFYNGRYHLFYIYQNEKRQHCFGHISSRDLFHWRHHPIAIAPMDGDADTGTFSGGAFLDKAGVPTIIYWGLGDNRDRRGGICLATSTDKNLDTWTKSPHNPVIPYPRAGDKEYELYTAVDPSAVWVNKGDGKYNVLTGNLQMMLEVHNNKPEFKKGDTVYLFQSDDLIHWRYKHEFYKSDRKWTANFEDNMCPDFFPLGNKQVMLFISHTKGCQYYLGQYENDRFTPEKHGRMTWVDHEFFAPETILDDQGRRIMWAWVFDRNSVSSQRAAGWAGLFSLPRVLTLGDDGGLRMNPPVELERLRYNEKTSPDQNVSADSEVVLKGVQGNVMELDVTLEPAAGAKQYGVVVARSADGAQQTRVFYDTADKKLKIDTTKSGKEGSGKIEGGPLELKSGEPLRLRVLVDKSIVEVFANDGRQAVSRRIYPDKESTGVALFGTGGDVKASNIKSWDIMPANPY